MSPSRTPTTRHAIAADGFGSAGGRGVAGLAGDLVQERRLAGLYRGSRRRPEPVWTRRGVGLGRAGAAARSLEPKSLLQKVARAFNNLQSLADAALARQSVAVYVAYHASLVFE